MVEQIFQEIEYLYNKEKFNKMNVEHEILVRCNGNGQILQEVMKLIIEYRENNDLDY